MGAPTPTPFTLSPQEITSVQEELKAHHFFSGEVNGVYNALTKQAVTLFQQVYGLPVTGEVDETTKALLFSNLSNEVVLPTPSPTPPPGAITVAEENIVPFKRVLQYGSEGKDVSKVQQQLMNLGYFTYHKTTLGYYGQTQEAVKDFQNQNGLPPTGKVDEDTWNALFNSAHIVDTKATPRPSPTPAPIPYHATVDVKSQVTTVYTYDENMEYTVPVRVMICSTGTTRYPTGLGEYILTGRRANWATFPTWGGGTAQYWVKIDGEIAFHSVMYDNYDHTKMSQSSFDALGRRASHGCIRLTTEDAHWLFNNLRGGTVINIVADAKTDKAAVAFAKYRKNHSYAMLPDTSRYSAELPAPAYRSIKEGSIGDDVMWLQMKLKELGHYNYMVTGYFSRETTYAIKAYQREVGHSATGKFSEKTYNALYQPKTEENAGK